MNIVLFDSEKYDVESIQKVFFSIKRASKSEEWIFLPKDFGVLLDCSTEQLYNVREYIDDAIREKEIINNM